MSLKKGKFALTVLTVKERPEDAEIIRRAQGLAAQPLNAVTDSDIGFASGKVLLDSNINEESCLIDNVLVLNVRCAKRVIDSGLLKATIQRNEESYKRLNKTDFVPKKEKRSIKEDAILYLSSDARLSVKGIELAFFRNKIFAATTCTNDVDAIMGLLAKMKIEAKYYGRTAFLPDLSTYTERMFLTDLLHSETEKDILIEGPIELAAYREADENMCSLATVKGGCVTKSDEVNFMLDAKKQVIKAKFTYAKSRNEVWSCVFFADAWKFGIMELPKDCESFLDRMEAIKEFLDMLEGKFRNYLKESDAKTEGNE